MPLHKLIKFEKLIWMKIFQLVLCIGSRMFTTTLGLSRNPTTNSRRSKVKKKHETQTQKVRRKLQPFKRVILQRSNTKCMLISHLVPGWYKTNIIARKLFSSAFPYPVLPSPASATMHRLHNLFCKIVFLRPPHPLPPQTVASFVSFSLFISLYLPFFLTIFSHFLSISLSFFLFLAFLSRHISI